MTDETETNEEKIVTLREELSRLRDDLDFYQIDHSTRIEGLERRMDEVIGAINVMKKL